MFGINPNKSTRLDGSGSGFFRSTWTISGDLITEAVLEVFKTRNMLHQLNGTIITLIPKVECPEDPSKYRPIACCYVVYKCVSITLCKRLKIGLPSLV